MAEKNQDFAEGGAELVPKGHKFTPQGSCGVFSGEARKRLRDTVDT
jgi:hypothetical protein